jgi:hypothetical protein
MKRAFWARDLQTINPLRTQSCWRAPSTGFVWTSCLDSLLGRLRNKIERMTLASKRDRNLNSFQIANSAPRLSVTASAIAPSATILANFVRGAQLLCCRKAKGEHMARVSNFCMWGTLGWAAFLRWRSSTIWSTMAETLCGTLLEFHDLGI